MDEFEYRQYTSKTELIAGVIVIVLVLLVVGIKYLIGV